MLIRRSLADGFVATGDPDSEAPAKRSNTLAPCSEGADAPNSGVNDEGAQEIRDPYPKGKLANDFGKILR